MSPTLLFMGIPSRISRRFIPTLTTTEMRLKSRAQATYIDYTSSSPMVLLANSGINTWRSTPSTKKANKPCFNFNKGLCQFGDYCKFLHNGVHDDMRTLQNLLAKLRFDGNSTSAKPFGTSTVQQRNGTNQHVAFHMNNNAPLLATLNSPHGFNNPPQAQHVHYTSAQPTFYSSAQPVYTHAQEVYYSLAQLAPQVYHPAQFGYQPTYQFVHDNYCTVEFDAFGFSVKDFLTRWMLLRCDCTGDLYPVTKPSTIPHAFLASQYTWHQRLGHPGSEVLHLVLSDIQFRVIKRHISFFVMHRLNLHVSSIPPLPISYSDAFNDPNWQKAMTDEYNALIKNNTWTLVPRPTDANIVHCMWLFRHKYLADDTLSRYKARLVANDTTQIEG
ncbi:ribonuclease H-like domain-containing protein [Tanacetum coccineum]